MSDETIQYIFEMPRTKRIEALLEAFAVTAESAVQEYKNRNLGGQKVPFHGDFANANPSVISKLEWWAREMRAALDMPKESP